MIATFDMFREVLALSDQARAGRDWALATGMVIQGKAAMQFQGDWANGAERNRSSASGVRGAPCGAADEEVEDEGRYRV
jgi:ABC-type glycerol-3-phosphate transport system substrate-binding protein